MSLLIIETTGAIYQRHAKLQFDNWDWLSSTARTGSNRETASVRLTWSRMAVDLFLYGILGGEAVCEGVSELKCGLRGRR
jgi:hypothetical protein